MAKKKGNKTVEAGAARFAKGIKSVDEASPYLKCLVYGRNGSGKTRFAASGPNCLIIDINEEGTRSAAGWSEADVREVRTFDDVAHGYWYLKAGNHEYETVAIDTVTALQQAAIRKVLGDQEDRDPTREPSMPDKRTWGRAGQLVNQLVLDFRNLPMHVVFLAQERIIDDEDGEGNPFHTPDLPAGTRGTLMGSVGVMGRIYGREVKVKNKKGKRSTKWEDRMLVGPHEDYDTKDRTNQLGRIVRNPTMPQVIEAWETRNKE
jgi:hypothetical protein